MHRGTMRWIVVGVCLFTSLMVNAHPEGLLAKRYEALIPAVVTIHTYEDTVAMEKTFFASEPNGLGSGVVISDDGLIVTASHVVHSVDGLYVEFHSGVKRSAKIISSVVWADLALIKVGELPPDVAVAQLGDSDEIRVGDHTFVIGAPLGLSKTLTVGVVSGKHPEVSYPVPRQAELLQTDAAINPGNSGGPMFNLDGKVIGIASHIKTRSGGSDGLGFAVSSNAIQKWLLDKRPFWSGIVFVPINNALTDALGLPFAGGALVQKVNRESQANAAGIRGGYIPAVIAKQNVMLGGDVIVAIDGTPLTDIYKGNQVIAKLSEKSTGDMIDVKLWRQGKYTIVKVKID